MDFETFINLIPQIAFRKYAIKQSQKESQEGIYEKCLISLLENNLIPLYEGIILETDLGNDLEKF